MGYLSKVCTNKTKHMGIRNHIAMEDVHNDAGQGSRACLCCRIASRLSIKWHTAFQLLNALQPELLSWGAGYHGIEETFNHAIRGRALHNNIIALKARICRLKTPA